MIDDKEKDLLYGFVNYVKRYYSQPKYQPTLTQPVKHTQVDFLKNNLDNLLDKYIKEECTYPNYTCGECVYWLAYENNAASYDEIKELYCSNCALLGRKN